MARLRAQLATRGRDYGATAVEYGLLVALIAGAIAVAVGVFGRSVVDLFLIPAGTL